MRSTGSASKEIVAAHKVVANDVITAHLRLAILVTLVLHPMAYFLDVTQYPHYAPIFLKIRIINCAVIALIYVASFVKAFRKYVVWFSDVAMLDIAAGIIAMIYISNGAPSQYYEGVNLAILGLFVINGFYPWHNLGTCLAILALYALAAFYNPTDWSLQRFLTANFFMGSTSLIMCVMTKLYSAQHMDGFIKNEELKLSEQKLAESNQKLAELYNRADKMARIDDLTQVYNRRHLMQILEAKVKISKELGGYFYLVIFDIDHFKHINDTYGHTVGDEVIRKVVELVNSQIRPTSYLGRYGGDEFMMIFDKAEKLTLIARLEGICQSIQEIDIRHNSERVAISISMGAVRVDPLKFPDITAVIAAADDVLLHIKRTGRGRVYVSETGSLE